MEEFIATPSLQLLDKLSKEQLLQVAEHFSVVVVGDKRIKGNIKNAIKEELSGSGVIPSAKPFCRHVLQFHLSSKHWG